MSSTVFIILAFRSILEIIRKHNNLRGYHTIRLVVLNSIRLLLTYSCGLLLYSTIKTSKSDKYYWTLMVSCSLSLELYDVFIWNKYSFDVVRNISFIDLVKCFIGNTNSGNNLFKLMVILPVCCLISFAYFQELNGQLWNVIYLNIMMLSTILIQHVIHIVVFSILLFPMDFTKLLPTSSKPVDFITDAIVIAFDEAPTKLINLKKHPSTVSRQKVIVEQPIWYQIQYLHKEFNDVILEKLCLPSVSTNSYLSSTLGVPLIDFSMLPNQSKVSVLGAVERGLIRRLALQDLNKLMIGISSRRKPILSSRKWFDISYSLCVFINMASLQVSS